MWDNYLLQGEESPNVANQILWRGRSTGLAIIFQDTVNERNDQKAVGPQKCKVSLTVD